MNRVMVLGANSFAGAQYIRHALEQGATVVGVNRSPEKNDIFYPYKHTEQADNYRFWQLDINRDLPRLFALLDDFQPQVMVDFAGQGMVAESWHAPAQWYQTNVVSKVTIHDFLKDKPWLQKYIRISTPEVYGSSEQAIDEAAPFNPSTPYAVSHAAIDMSLMAFHRQYGLPVVFTRFSNFYGPGQQLYRIIPRAIIYALTGQKLLLHGGGKAVRAFIYGADVATAVAATIERGEPGEVYHFSASEFLAIADLVAKIHSFLNVSGEALIEHVADRPGKDMRYLMDDSKARRLLHWAPRTSIDRGIEQTINWVSNNLETIKSLPLHYEHKA